jgi:hypothetical protein
LGLQSSPQIEDVKISTQSHVVGNVPTNVVWILINHDLVSVPEPVPAKVDIVWSNTEEEAAEPETARPASFNPKDMAWAKTTPKTSTLPSTIQMEVRITTATFMSDPLAVTVNVGRVGMSRPVVECVVLCYRMLSSPDRSGTVSRDVPAANLVTIALMSFLGNGADTTYQQRYGKSD